MSESGARSERVPRLTAVAAGLVALVSIAMTAFSTTLVEAADGANIGGGLGVFAAGLAIAGFVLAMCARGRAEPSVSRLLAGAYACIALAVPLLTLLILGAMEEL